MVLSALGFALMGALVKIAGARGFPVLEIIAARALISLGISVWDARRKGIDLLGGLDLSNNLKESRVLQDESK